MHRPIYTGHELTYVSGHVCCCCFFFFFFHLKDSQCLLQSSWIGKSIFFPAANELGGPSVWPGLSSAGLLPGQGLACSTEILLGTKTGSQGVIHGIVWDPLGSKKCAKGFGENWIGSQSQSGRRAVSAGAASLEVDTRGRYWVSLSLQKSRAVMGLLGTTSTRKWLKGHLRWCWWSWLQAEPCWCPCPQDLPEQLTVHHELPKNEQWGVPGRSSALGKEGIGGSRASWVLLRCRDQNCSRVTLGILLSHQKTMPFAAAWIDLEKVS